MKADAKKEFWLQFTGAMIRKLLFSLGTLLQGYGYISHDQAQGFSSGQVALHLSGLAFMAAPVVWQYAKTRFNIKFSEAARKADPGTPHSLIKAGVLRDEKHVTSF
jgi:hypothetical protein